MNLKQKSAQAAFALIHNGMTIGLGGGTTIAYLSEMIAESNLDMKIVTPSLNTQLKLKELGLTCIPLNTCNHVDLAFDGCDEADENGYALKSGGGIHTAEKIIASMSDQYILLIDESKLSPSLTFKHPVVIEVIADALEKVIQEVKAIGAQVDLRRAPNKDGALRSDYGNILLDAYFKPCDPETLYTALIKIVGVVEVSLFVYEVNQIMIASDQGIRIITK